MTLRVDGYWCEVVVRSPEAGAEWLLGFHRAGSPSDAMRWLTHQGRRIAYALDPQPGAGPFPASALRRVEPEAAHIGRVFHEWLEDPGYQETQRKALERGQHVSANAGMPDHVFGQGETLTHVSLSCRPLVSPGASGFAANEAHYAAAPHSWPRAG